MHTALRRTFATTAATVLVVDRSPQGAEHVKKMLVGSLLSVTADEVLKFSMLYAAIGVLHWLVRRPLLAASDNTGATTPDRKTIFWDLVFYLSFGVVVTSSVGVAGVLLVFCFLIVPALIGTLFSSHIGVALLIGWAAGVAASAAGSVGNPASIHASSAAASAIPSRGPLDIPRARKSAALSGKAGGLQRAGRPASRRQRSSAALSGERVQASSTRSVKRSFPRR